MNKHLNIFKTYAKDDRSYQLENDLTRALAICLQEDALFCHEILKAIIDDSALYNKLFEDLDGETNIQIEIQKKASLIDGFEKVFAVSLSESCMSDFWKQTLKTKYDPVCDLVVTINNIVIVIEAKRNDTDCAAQLYNQIFNIFNDEKDIDIKFDKDSVKPFDLNWIKLMAIAVKVASFEKTTGNSNRFLTDFIKLVKDHNFRWLPETPIASLKGVNHKSIHRRLESAVTEFCKNSEGLEKLTYNDRLGTTFSKRWANEVLFRIDTISGDLVASIYPGNTKGQGRHIFKEKAKFTDNLMINGDLYSVNRAYHIKFMGQSHITGLWLTDKDFNSPHLYTVSNFNKYSGRVKRGAWGEVEKLLDKHLNIDWKDKCQWQDKLIKSKRTLFNIAFGYHISLRVPLNELTQLDTNHDDIAPLAGLIESIYRAFEDKLLIEGVSA